MSAKIIVSYDGTANEDDAIALGRIFARTGAEVSLAYVRHTYEPDSDRETLAQSEAQELLERGAALFGNPGIARQRAAARPAGALQRGGADGSRTADKPAAGMVATADPTITGP